MLWAESEAGHARPIKQAMAATGVTGLHDVLSPASLYRRIGKVITRQLTRPASARRKPGCAAAGQWLNRAVQGKNEFMRAETEKLVEDIKRSIGLLRRHL